MTAWRITTALAIAALAIGARADAPAVSIPLGVTTPGPIRQLFLDAVLTDARAVTTPALQLRLETANSWSVPTRIVRGTDSLLVQTDAQADALVLSAVIPWSIRGGADGWRGRLATTVGWRVTQFWGGFEDGGIEAWHHVIGSTNFLRDRYPRDEVHIELLSSGGAAPLDIHSARLAWGDLVVGTQALLASGGRSAVTGAADTDPSWGVATRLDVKLPIGSLARAGGSGGWDAALSLLGSAELEPWLVAHARTSAAVFSALGADSALQPRTFHGAAEVSLVLLAGSWALVLEDRLLSSLFDGGGWTVLDGRNSDFFLASPAMSLFRAHNQITVGIRRGRYTLSLSEDFTPGSNPRGAVHWFYNSNAPDVVLALTARLPI